jgi:3',5'-nucleoside bisphosphate phosphatase
MCEALAGLDRPAADLHTHTTASDGDWTPSRVVIAAREAGLTAVAVTDHDTTAGVAEAVTTAADLPGRKVAVVAGVEVSATWNGYDVHVLGLGVDPTRPKLVELLAAIRDRRRARFRAMIAALHHPALSERAGLLATTETSLGRRHVAKLAVEVGLGRTVHDAIRRLISPLQVPADHSAPFADAVEAIADAGGLAVFAHPHPRLTSEDLHRLRGDGLAGIECRFPAATASRTVELRTWAADLGLVVTAGSDFHGPGAGRTVGGIALAGGEYARFSARAGCIG